jgi:hypothetical protein
VKGVNWRAQLALEAFEGRELLYIDDLPAGVGEATVRKLLARNVVHLVEVQNGTFSRERALRLVH